MPLRSPALLASTEEIRGTATFFSFQKGPTGIIKLAYATLCTVCTQKPQGLFSTIRSRSGGVCVCTYGRIVSFNCKTYMWDRILLEKADWRLPKKICGCCGFPCQHSPANGQLTWSLGAPLRCFSQEAASGARADGCSHRVVLTLASRCWI